MTFRFYLGTHVANWIYKSPSPHPLFVSIRTLNRIKNLKPALNDWCLDSGGFTELTLYDAWKTSPDEHIDNVRRSAEMGRMVWASPQDWMCEPHMLDKTGKTVEEHQHLTCANFVELTTKAPELPFIPVLQGWNPDDYRAHVDMYATYGVNLWDWQTVGLGSFCRRTKFPGIRELVVDLSRAGLKLHGFGLKKDGLKMFRNHLVSSDSMAWSLTARMAGRNGKLLCGRSHNAKSCSNCRDWAMMWADGVAATQQDCQTLLWE